MGAVVTGLVIAIAGAVIWASVAAGLGIEIGWLAWGVGLAVGVSVKAGAGGRGSSGLGVLAIVLALGAIVTGKLGAAYFMAGEAAEEAGVYQDQFDPQEFAITLIADEVAAEWEDQGRTINWPDGAEPYAGTTQAEYPTDVWADANARWLELSDNEQEEYLASANIGMDVAIGVVTIALFIASFGLFDLLWVFLAVGSAYKIASSEGAGQANAASQLAGDEPWNPLPTEPRGQKHQHAASETAPANTGLPEMPAPTPPAAPTGALPGMPPPADAATTPPATDAPAPSDDIDDNELPPQFRGLGGAA